MNSSSDSRAVVVCIANGKGGVGKTSVTVNLAAECARRGIRTLVVDLDPQGNTALDLGIYEHDQGKSLGAAVSYDLPLQPMPAVRANLGYVPAGPATANMHAVLAQNEAKSGTEGLCNLRNVLWNVADYDLIIMDTPPAHSNRTIVDAALIAADWVLIPTKHDAASILGIQGVIERLREVTARNYSTARPLGVVLFGLAAASKSLRAEAADELVAGLADVPLLHTIIRSSERAAYDLRDRGVTATEYARDAEAASGDRLRALRSKATKDLTRYASGADKLAQDYSELTDEILATMGFRAMATV